MSLAQFGHLRAIISEVPQLAQAFQPDSTPLPQCGQCCLASNDLPHCGQAFHPGWTGVEQDGHPWVVGVAVAGDGGSGCGAVMLVKFTVGPEATTDVKSGAREGLLLLTGSRIFAPGHIGGSGAAD